MTLPAIIQHGSRLHTAIVGATGGGKTNTAKVIIEEAVARGERVCIFDPIKSDHWGLTSSADGKNAGLPFGILGGPHGHVPLHPGTGKAIAELVASGRLPLSILDMADFPMGGLAEFFCDFAPALLRKMKGVVNLVLEEAHEFAPKERSGIGKENMLVHFAKKLATAGRSKGVRLIVVTQRVQALHNAVLGSCQHVIAHRLVLDADKQPVVKWLQANADKSIAKQVADSLASLTTGTAWIFSSETGTLERCKLPQAFTYDNTKTPTGKEDLDAITMASVDLDHLRNIMGAAVQEAEASDPKNLKSRVRALEAELDGVRTARPAVDQDAIAAAVAANDKHWKGVLDECLVRLVGGSVNSLAMLIERAGEDARRKVEDLKKDVDRIRTRTLQERGVDPAVERDHRVRIMIPPKPVMPAPPPRSAPRGTPAADLPKGEAVILTAIAQHRGGCDREQISVLTGYKRSSRDTYLQRLSQRGMIDTTGANIQATSDGVAALGDDFDPLPTGARLRQYWLERLSGGERAILSMLIGKYPFSVPRDDLSDHTGYKRSSRDTYLQRLTARKLIDSTRAGVKASDTLF
jgi:hypothetical protein